MSFRRSVLRHIAYAIMLALPLMGLAASAHAEADGLPGPDQPEARGLAIAKETDKLNTGWGDSEAKMEMVLSNAQGDKSTRELRFYGLERPDPNEGDWSLIVFDKPRDVDGTALLTHAKVLEPDDQWLYLPAVKRVKRISSVNKSGPFVGSEFAFEDFSSNEVGKYSYNWLRDEPCGDLTCHVVERKPLYDHSGYTRQVVWTDTKDYQPRKIDYYDRKNALLKTLTLSDYHLYEGKYWRARDLYMVNHTNKKATRLIWKDYKFNTGLTEADFSTTALKRAR